MKKHLQILDLSKAEVQYSIATVKIMFAKRITLSMVEQESFAMTRLKLLSKPLNLN